MVTFCVLFFYRNDIFVIHHLKIHHVRWNCVLSLLRDNVIKTFCEFYIIFLYQCIIFTFSPKRGLPKKGRHQNKIPTNALPYLKRKKGTDSIRVGIKARNSCRYWSRYQFNIFSNITFINNTFLLKEFVFSTEMKLGNDNCKNNLQNL